MFVSQNNHYIQAFLSSHYFYTCSKNTLEVNDWKNGHIYVKQYLQQKYENSSWTNSINPVDNK